MAFAEVYSHARTVLSKAVALDFPLPFRSGGEGRPAAVLVLGGFRANGEGNVEDLELLFTRRTEQLETHKGQYAFPGGMREGEAETPAENALRETEEEMGIPPSAVEIIGSLPALSTPSGFRVTPVVGFLRFPIEQVVIHPNPSEIDVWFWSRVVDLLAPGVYSTEMRTITHLGVVRSVPTDIYQVGEHRIWGVTGAMLRNFLGRLEKIG